MDKDYYECKICGINFKIINKKLNDTHELELHLVCPMCKKPDVKKVYVYDK